VGAIAIVSENHFLNMNDIFGEGTLI